MTSTGAEGVVPTRKLPVPSTDIQAGIGFAPSAPIEWVIVNRAPVEQVKLIDREIAVLPIFPVNVSAVENTYESSIKVRAESSV